MGRRSRSTKSDFWDPAKQQEEENRTTFASLPARVEYTSTVLVLKIPRFEHPERQTGCASAASCVSQDALLLQNSCLCLSIQRLVCGCRLLPLNSIQVSRSCDPLSPHMMPVCTHVPMMSITHVDVRRTSQTPGVARSLATRLPFPFDWMSGGISSSSSFLFSISCLAFLSANKFLSLPFLRTIPEIRIFGVKVVKEQTNA